MEDKSSGIIFQRSRPSFTRVKITKRKNFIARRSHAKQQQSERKNPVAEIPPPTSSEKCSFKIPKVKKPALDDSTSSTSASTSPVVDVDSSEGAVAVERLIIVPDTNIWIRNLGLLNFLLEDAEFPKVGKPTILIPWMVLQELDVLIHKNNTEQRISREPINFIYSLLSKQHPRVRGQKASEAAVSKLAFDELIADDSILNCALQSQTDRKAIVIFLSNDKNLLNKAMVSGVEACDSQSLMEKITSLFGEDETSGNDGWLSKSLFTLPPVPNYSTTVRVKAAARRKLPENPTNQRYNNNVQPQKYSPGFFTLPPMISVPNPTSTGLFTLPPVNSVSNPSTTVRSNAAVKRKLPDNPPTYERFNTNRQQASTVIVGVAETFMDCDDDPFDELGPPVSKIKAGGQPFSTAEAKKPSVSQILLQAFSFIIRWKMVEDYGNDGWEYALKVKPPWTLQTSIKCMLVHWIANFSFVFSPKGKSHMEKLSDLVQKYNSYSGMYNGEQLEKEISETALGLFNLGDKEVMSQNAVVLCRRALIDIVADSRPRN